jgi:hypothetical protein
VASTIKAGVDVRELYEDLRAAEGGLQRVLAREVRRAADDIADGAANNMKLGTEDWAVKPGEPQLPHIRDTYRVQGNGIVAEITSDHPAAPVWEWGGLIHPRGMFVQTISIPTRHPVNRAADDELDIFERHLQEAVDRLLAKFNL